MKLLLTGAWRQAEQYIPLLESNGHEVCLMQNEQGALPCDPSEIEGIVCNGLFLYHDIHLFRHLRYIQLTSAGFDRIDMDYVKARGIEIHNARGVYSIPMAEHTVAAVLNIYRNSSQFIKNQERRLWQKDRSLRELYGSTVCVIGCGSVGKECAERFVSFGCRVVGVDIDSSPSRCFDTVVATADMLDAVASADVIILTLPLTVQTEGMVDAAFLRAVKDGGVLVNIARGRLIDTDALTAELEKRRIFAALDVFDEEPLPFDSPLWTLENVLITPHNSFVSDAVNDRLSRLIMQALK